MYVRSLREPFFYFFYFFSQILILLAISFNLTIILLFCSRPQNYGAPRGLLDKFCIFLHICILLTFSFHLSISFFMFKAPNFGAPRGLLDLLLWIFFADFGSSRDFLSYKYNIGHTGHRECSISFLNDRKNFSFWSHYCTL